MLSSLYGQKKEEEKRAQREYQTYDAFFPAANLEFAFPWKVGPSVSINSGSVLLSQNREASIELAPSNTQLSCVKEFLFCEVFSCFDGRQRWDEEWERGPGSPEARSDLASSKQVDCNYIYFLHLKINPFHH